MPTDAIIKNKAVFLFTMADCRPCKNFKPTFTEVSQMPEFFEVDFSMKDATQEPELANAMGIMSVPATVMLLDGQPVSMYPGELTKELFIEKIKNDLKV